MASQDSQRPTINLADFMHAAMEHKDQLTQYANSKGMVFDPTSNSFIADPTYVNPLQNAQLTGQNIQNQSNQNVLDAQTDPVKAALLAQSANTAAYSTSDVQAAQAQLAAKIAAIQNLKDAAGNTGGLSSLLSHIPGLSSVINPGYANALAAAQASGVQGLNSLVPGQQASSSLASILDGLRKQQQAYVQPIPTQAYAPSAGSLNVQLPNAAPQSSYAAGSPQMLTPGQLGANAYNLNGR